MRRARIELAAIADLDNLARAAFAAGRGKRSRPEAMAFFADLEASLARLAEGILAGTRPIGRYRAFTVWDPKRRVIHAPCFEDRVLHHALFAHAGPVLERGMVDSSFACRVGKGPLAAVHRAQSALRSWPWYVKVDVQGYFSSAILDHGRPASGRFSRRTNRRSLPRSALPLYKYCASIAQRPVRHREYLGVGFAGKRRYGPPGGSQRHLRFSARRTGKSGS